MTIKNLQSGYSGTFAPEGEFAMAAEFLGFYEPAMITKMTIRGGYPRPFEGPSRYLFESVPGLFPDYDTFCRMTKLSCDYLIAVLEIPENEKKIVTMIQDKGNMIHDGKSAGF